jgi:transitional endoplasmic reticulum ATPase
MNKRPAPRTSSAPVVGQIAGDGASIYDALVATWLDRLSKVVPRIAHTIAEDNEYLIDWPEVDRRESGDLEGLGVPLGLNVGMLASLLELNALEKRVLCFAVMLSSHPRLLAVCCRVNNCSNDRLAWLISVALKCDMRAVSTTLQRSGSLAKSGLMTVDSAITEFTSKLVLKEDLAALLLADHTRESLLANFFDIPPGTALGIEDYAHVKEHVQLLVRLLDGAVKECHAGVNVLIYGAPATGKTELAKVLAKEIGVEMYAVRSADEKGGSALRHERLVSYKL